jgi:hypothetical protein
MDLNNGAKELVAIKHRSSQVLYLLFFQEELGGQAG